MMNRKKSNISSSLKYAVLLPIALVILVFFGINDLPSKTPVIIKADSVYVNPDEMASFPGGEKALQNFIISNIKYPETCRENKIQGKVIIDFTVTKTGKIENIYVSLGANPELDKEGMRVIGLMPDWNPGKLNGKAVDTKLSMPFNFKLQ
jgi:protein TonB